MDMDIIFISDIVGRHGRKATKLYLDELLSDKTNKDYFVIANVENASGGFGLTEKNYNDLSEYGVDCMTSGNHIWDKKEVFDYINESEVLIRPLNYPNCEWGTGYKIFDVKGIKIAVTNCGFALKYAFELLLKEGIEYDYVIRLDADNHVNDEFFSLMNDAYNSEEA